MPLQVELVSAEAEVWSGQAREIIARTTEGDIGVLSGHAPTLAVLAAGQVQIFLEGGETVFAAVDDGFLSIEHDRVRILSDTAALVSSSGN